MFKDGTWKYINADDAEANTIPVSKKKYKKDKSSTFLLKSKVVDMGFWLDPKLWSFEKPSVNDEAEYELTLRGEDLYGMIISEKTEIPLETMRDIALQNGRAVAPDLQIIEQEFRMVNGLRVLFLQMNGNMQGISFSYYGYYYSDESGTVQFITYTSQNLLKEYLNTCEDLLNGLVVLDEDEKVTED